MPDRQPDVQTDSRARLAASFGSGGSAYDRLRPSYPPAAMDWLLPEGIHTVADIGAGTGKLSRVLADAGLEVYAVDPSADMLGEVGHPRVRTVVGTGEATTLPDCSVDAATFAQSWHWVDPARAGIELARILRPGGRVALLWNLLDVSVPWVCDYSDAMHSVSNLGDGIEGRVNQVVDLDGFTPFVQHQVPWHVVTTHADLLALPQTRSYWMTASERDQVAALERVRDVVARAPYTSDGRVALPYVTQVARADRR